MSNKRALVSCTVLSLQDSCFVYPCCKGCLSRLSQESKRAICGRCGFTCDLQNVDYRYRLSFKVSRNQDIFGVTVFGGCLNPFFGITAGGLQRCIDLEKTEGTHTVQQLLVKAVEDCFIGRCVIFGLKVPHNVATSSLSGQLVACQIISPLSVHHNRKTHNVLKEMNSVLIILLHHVQSWILNPAMKDSHSQAHGNHLGYVSPRKN
ncbi:DNA damage-induced apoptosis suppressor protein-like [Sinocyclocheilus rhinocerous]|nr:PREDICTED: DNA damage-induced apoptosis suppressor protein-like [Sinocyclocheilus rhinocerous]